MELIGERFMAYRDAVQQYSGLAIVIKRKKSGLYLCRGALGQEFEEPKYKIARHLVSLNDDPLRSA